MIYGGQSMMGGGYNINNMGYLNMGAYNYWSVNDKIK